jgi:bacterioferritin
MSETNILIRELKKALADEWFAFVQYINASEIAAGPLRESIAKDLKENAMEEFEHIQKLNYRIVQLGGTPILDPAKWTTYSTCGIIVPKTVFSIQLAKDALRSEECAIQVYRKIADMARDMSDHVTYDIIQDILEDEEEHKFEMETFIKDYEVCIQTMQSGGSLSL